jgi:hypothetical protein
MRTNRSDAVLLIAAIVIVYGVLSASAIEVSDRKETSLQAGQELAILLDCDRYEEIMISVQTLSSDSTCVYWYTYRKDGDELPEEEIGPRADRTIEIEGLLKKVVGVDCHGDELVLHLETGEAEVALWQIAY